MAESNPAGVGVKYTAEVLLFLRDSPLCVKPAGLPPAEEWMGYVWFFILKFCCKSHILTTMLLQTATGDHSQPDETYGRPNQGSGRSSAGTTPTWPGSDIFAKQCECVVPLPRDMTLYLWPDANPTNRP